MAPDLLAARGNSDGIEGRGRGRHHGGEGRGNVGLVADNGALVRLLRCGGGDDVAHGSARCSHDPVSGTNLSQARTYYLSHGMFQEPI
uniref:Uncharacterized protein n=1 Tax=Oryza sativa subsp. japonica TaxID=39947 RepID=Q6ZAG7_ORYSJ|nr:hypothetical protein [Oryza sativa Japonica Group]BAD09778.1 hypothetical protein [Oryza sativa Japonica Group]